MNSTARLLAPGVAAAFGADLLFGAGTPLAKLLLRDVSPWLLAGLFYLGSGIGLSLFRFLKRAEPVRLARGEVGWLAGAVLAGGGLASCSSASSAGGVRTGPLGRAVFSVKFASSTSLVMGDESVRGGGDESVRGGVTNLSWVSPSWVPGGDESVRGVFPVTRQ